MGKKHTNDNIPYFHLFLKTLIQVSVLSKKVMNKDNDLLADGSKEQYYISAIIIFETLMYI